MERPPAAAGADGWPTAQPTLHVFEPSRFTFDRLAETLAGTEGVHLSRLGVSLRLGTAVLHKPREGAGSSSLHQGWPCETASEEVSLTTLDEYCADARWVHARRYLRDAFTFADALGYQLGKVTPRGIEFYEAWHPELESFRRATISWSVPKCDGACRR
jgi:hypothetical protein